MTIRNLNHLFKPDSIALIGRGDDSDVVIARNLMHGGFQGPVMPVDGTRRALHGARTYPDIASLPLPPALAVLNTPLLQVPELIRALGERGARAAVLVGDPGQIRDPAQRNTLYQDIRQAARPWLLRVLGPGSMGLIVPLARLHASLSTFHPLSGTAALVTQSAGIAQAALDSACHQNFGFSHLISLGEAVDVDLADVLDYLTNDYRTRAILLYVEHIRDARKFMSAARRAARLKPVIVLKPQQFSHEGVDDAVYAAAFRRAGILRVDDRHELFNMVEALNAAKLVRSDRLAILSNSYSIAMLAADSLYQLDGRLAQFSEATQEGLEHLANPLSAALNPVDLGDQAGPEAFGQALDLVLEDKGVDGILVIKAPNALADALPVAAALVARLPHSRRCLLASFPGPGSGDEARHHTAAHKIPTFESSKGAVRAFMRIVQYKRNQELLMETPPSLPEAFTPDIEAARALINAVLAAGRDHLDEHEALQLLAAYCIPVVETRVAHDPEEAAAVAADWQRAVAIKILSPDILDKSQVGGMARYLDSPDAVRETARTMQQRVRNLAPSAQIDGFLIQPIHHRDGAYEMTLGVRPGGHFGPVIFFGQGGTETRVIGDLAYGLPPLNMHLAREIMSQTRIGRMLRYSLLRRADLNALALTLVKVSQMVIDLGEIAELDINPLRASDNGVLALDAAVRLAPFAGELAHRLAIRPYPKELEEPCRLYNGRELLLRPILPEDEPALHLAVQRAPAEDLRLRFFQPIRELSHETAARLTQIDYNREIALVAVEPGQLPGQAEIYGMVHLNADPDNETAEYSILVDRTMMRLGLGSKLMQRIIDYARARGIREIYGEVLQENEPMLQLDKALGFRIQTPVDDPGLRHVTLRLDVAAVPGAPS